MLAHDIGAWSTIETPDLTKVLLDQIGVFSVVLWVPKGTHIIKLFVVVGIFNLLLKPELLKYLKID